MTASTRGMVVLAAIAAVLVALLALDLARTPPAVESHALLPAEVVANLDRIDALTWTRAGAAERDPNIRATRTPAGGWLVDGAQMDPQALDAIVSALRGARWHREGTRHAAGEVRSILQLGSTSFGIGFGAKLGDDQQWLVLTDPHSEQARALLVDAWVARALDPSRLSLVVRAPFAAHGQPSLAVRGSGADALAVDLVRGVETAPTTVQLAPERLAAVRAALDGVVFVTALPPSARSVRRGSKSALTVTVGAAQAELGEPCPDTPTRVAAYTSVGDGCIERAAMDALAAALAPLAADPIAIADPRPIAAPPTEIELGEGAQLSLDRTPSLHVGSASEAVEPSRVLALVSALTEPATVTVLPPVDRAPQPRRTLTVHTGAAQTILDIFADHVVRRGEPVALKPSAAALAALLAPTADLGEASLWVEDASAIAAIRIDGATFTRGAVLGEWSSPARATQLEQLAAAVAAPRANPDEPHPPARPAGMHAVELELRSPLGETARRALSIAKIGARCALYADGRAAWIDARACDALAP